MGFTFWDYGNKERYLLSPGRRSPCRKAGKQADEIQESAPLGRLSWQKYQQQEECKMGTKRPAEYRVSSLIQIENGMEHSVAKLFAAPEVLWWVFISKRKWRGWQGGNERERESTAAFRFVHHRNVALLWRGLILSEELLGVWVTFKVYRIN